MKSDSALWVDGISKTLIGQRHSRKKYSCFFEIRILNDLLNVCGYAYSCDQWNWFIDLILIGIWSRSLLTWMRGKSVKYFYCTKYFIISFLQITKNKLLVFIGTYFKQKKKHLMIDNKGSFVIFIFTRE